MCNKYSLETKFCKMLDCDKLGFKKMYFGTGNGPYIKCCIMEVDGSLILLCKLLFPHTYIKLSYSIYVFLFTHSDTKYSHCENEIKYNHNLI